MDWLSLLRSDIPGFNKARRGKTLDLRGADLRGLDLSRAHLSPADLSGADLRGSRVRGAVLVRCRLADARLDGVECTDGHEVLEQVRLLWSDPAGFAVRREAEGLANLTMVDLSGAALAGLDLRGVTLDGARLDQTHLRDADLTGARMVGVSLRLADLRGARLEDADLRDADLTGALFEGALLRRAVLKGATLDGARFEGADTEDADFSRTVGLAASGREIDRLRAALLAPPAHRDEQPGDRVSWVAGHYRRADLLEGLRELASDDDPALADAARDALALLDR